jgi:hypothetical protein
VACVRGRQAVCRAAAQECLELANRCLIESSRTLDREAADTLSPAWGGGSVPLGRRAAAVPVVVPLSAVLGAAARPVLGPGPRGGFAGGICGARGDGGDLWGCVPGISVTWRHAPPSVGAESHADRRYVHRSVKVALSVTQTCGRGLSNEKAVGASSAPDCSQGRGGRAPISGE